VGAKTKKVLFVGVRNKYCCICQKASKNNMDPKEHICFKNWNLPSTAMEADIIVEGFKKSIDMHNLIYSRLIGNYLTWHLFLHDLQYLHQEIFLFKTINHKNVFSIFI
jgi:hypothetical protein